MEPIKAAALIAASVAGVALLVLTPKMYRRRREVGIVAALVAVAALGGSAFTVISDMETSERHESVWVTPVPPEAPDFSFAVRHRRVHADGDIYKFKPDVSDAEMISILTKKFPQGSLAESGGGFTVIEASTRFDIYPSDDSTWIAQRETASVHNGPSAVIVSFPRGAVAGAAIQVNEPTPLLIDPDTVAAELVALGADQNDDGTLTVLGHSGSRVTLAVDDGDITAQLD